MEKFKSFTVKVFFALTYLPFIIAMMYGMQYSDKIWGAIGFIGIIVWSLVCPWIISILIDKNIIK